MPIAVLSLVQQLVDLGIQDISIGDTIGKATPEMTQELLDLLLSKFSKDIFAMHFHDTYQMALQNVETSLSYGITKYDSSAAGIGGCPFAPGAKGNVSTNELVAFFKSKNIQTGIDQTKLQEATDFILNVLGKI